MKTVISTAAAPAAIGPYSQAIDLGSIVITSGRLPIDPATGAFPAGMLTVDMLSDSGTTAMTDIQWSALMLGDEAYGRNNGYYCLLDAFRDIFERGGEANWKNAIDLIRTGCKDTVGSFLRPIA